MSLKDLTAHLISLIFFTSLMSGNSPAPLPHPLISNTSDSYQDFIEGGSVPRSKHLLLYIAFLF